jgi:hypothetical protein
VINLHFAQISLELVLHLLFLKVSFIQSYGVLIVNTRNIQSILGIVEFKIFSEFFTSGA